MALPSATDVEYVGSGTSGGVCVGRAATDLVGFFGTTPADQRARSAQAALTLTTTTSSNAYGFVTTTGLTAFIAQVEEIRATLVEHGLMKGSA